MSRRSRLQLIAPFCLQQIACLTLCSLLGAALLGSPVQAQDANADDDGDGLLNGWEINGYDANGDGVVDVDLPALGANYLRKDVFIEIDWMQGASCNQKPASAGIAEIVSSFAAAPVSNPDGSTGITLHVDYGQGGGLTGGNALACDDVLSWPSEFQALKAANFAPARQAIFHYNIWGIQYDAGGGVTGSSGISELPGDDFLVSLGAFPGGNGTQDQQAGTFMHELGHNFDFLHGGSDNVNYKPNHLSVMSYSFQLTGVIRNGDFLFDYQRYDIAALNERSLDEAIGLNGGPELAAEGTVWYCNRPQRTRSSTSVDALDWNCSGEADGIVASDINNDRLRRNLRATPNQWTSLVYDGGAIGNREAGGRSVRDNLRLLPASSSIAEELKAAELLQIEREVREAVRSQ